MTHDIRERLQVLSQDAGRLADRHARNASPLQIGDAIVELVCIVQAMAIDLYPAKLPDEGQDAAIAAAIRKAIDHGVLRGMRGVANAVGIDPDKDIAAARVHEANGTAPPGEEARVRNEYAAKRYSGDVVHPIENLDAIDEAKLSPQVRVDLGIARLIGATALRYGCLGPRYDVSMTPEQADRYASAIRDDDPPFDDRRHRTILWDGFDWSARDQFDAERMGWKLSAHDDGQIMVYSAGDGEDNDVGEAVRKLAENQGASHIVLALRPGTITLGTMKPADASQLCKRATIICDLSERMVIGDRAVAAHRKASKEGRRDLQNILAPIVDEIV